MKLPLLALIACLGIGATTTMLAQTHSSHDSANDTGHSTEGAAMNHAAHQAGAETKDQAAPTETGQSAFAAIAEIVALIDSNPDTNWEKVDIDALQAHLADMDAVTLGAKVATRHIDGGAVFDVTSTHPDTASAIRRMLLAHGKTMSGTGGFQMASVEIESGAQMTVTGDNPAKIRGLGFFGVLTLGMHHQAHHLALASGSDPHN